MSGGLLRGGNPPNDGMEDNLISQDGDSRDGQQNVNMGVQENDQTQTEPYKYTTQTAVLFITVNVTIGVGLLAMPLALQMAGLVPSLIIQLFFFALIVVTCIMCVELTVKTKVNSYHEIIQTHCHPYVYQFTQISILLIVFGTTVAYIVTIGDQADRLYATLTDINFCHHWYMNRLFTMSFSTVFLITPLCCIKTVDFLKYGSFLGVASIGFIVYLVTSEFMRAPEMAKDYNLFSNSWNEVASILPVFCLCYQIHISLVPIVATVRPSEKPKAFVTSSISILISTIIYAWVSILAVLTFGGKIKSDLTENYPGNDWAVLTTIGIVGVKCILTLPAAFLPARLSLMDIASGFSPRFGALSEPIRRISVTKITLSAALMLALFVPNILVAVNLLGCLAVMLIFTLPGLAYINLVKQNRIEKQQLAGFEQDPPLYNTKDHLKRLLSFFIIFFGILMTIVVLYKSIEEIFNNKSTAEALCKP